MAYSIAIIKKLNLIRYGDGEIYWLVNLIQRSHLSLLQSMYRCMSLNTFSAEAPIRILFSNQS